MEGVYTDVNLNEYDLPSCKRCSNSGQRLAGEDGICPEVRSVLDGEILRCVGPWAHEKIFYLVRYFHIFAKGMFNKWNGNLRYIEVCSGPGRCSNREGVEQDGTALAIVKHDTFKYVQRALFIDYNESVVNVLNQRIVKLGIDNKATALVGDFNQPTELFKVIKNDAFNGLSLCLIDPTECNIPFESIRQIYLATNRKCDFLISVFDGVDFMRNAVAATLDPAYSKVKKKYEDFLGDSKFFAREDVKDAAKRNSSKDITIIFRRVYQEKFASLGLMYCDWKPVKNFYHLFYVSANPRGLDFWKKSCAVEPTGQSFFPGF